MATSRPPTRLAILMADTPLPGTQAKYTNYGGVFRALFEAAAAPAPLSDHLSLTFHDVVSDPASYPSLDDVDALLVTGSKHDAHAEGVPWIDALVAYVRDALLSAREERVRVVGVCFGHQIVGRALGSPVVRSDGWEVSVTDVALTEAGRAFFGLDTMKIQQMHRDIVTRLPEPSSALGLAEGETIQLLGSTDACTQQGMLIPGRAVTVQGHPEFNEEIMREILELRHETGLHTDELYRSGMDRAADRHDGVAIARAFLRFIRS